jgi:hypothetical protein
MEIGSAELSVFHRFIMYKELLTVNVTWKYIYIYKLLNTVEFMACWFKLSHLACSVGDQEVHVLVSGILLYK